MPAPRRAAAARACRALASAIPMSPRKARSRADAALRVRYSPLCSLDRASPQPTCTASKEALRSRRRPAPRRTARYSPTPADSSNRTWRWHKAGSRHTCGAVEEPPRYGALEHSERLFRRAHSHARWTTADRLLRGARPSGKRRRVVPSGPPTGAARLARSTPPRFAAAPRTTRCKRRTHPGSRRDPTIPPPAVLRRVSARGAGRDG